MALLPESENAELYWRRVPNLNCYFELVADGEVVAYLNKDLFGIRAETSEGVWLLEPRGRFSRTIRVRQPDSEVDIAVLDTNQRDSAILECSDGHRFLWRQEGRRQPTCSWVNHEGEPLITFRPDAMLGRGGMRVEVARRARSLPELTLLLLCGIYQLFDRGPTIRWRSAKVTSELH